MNDKKKKILLIVFMVGVVTALIFCMLFIYIKIVKGQPDGPGAGKGSVANNFNNKIINAVHEKVKNENYMISPYSIEVVLSMLRDGASETTLEELNKLVPERTIKDFDVKERINVANALFIKNGVTVKKDFQHVMTTKYLSKVIRDDFKTPNAINKWADKETYGMISKVLENISEDFLFGLGNAVAIDVEWQSKFECYATRLEKFNTIDGKKIDVAMMHQTYESGAGYRKDDIATYVSIPYVTYGSDGKRDENGTKLEFIGILPKEDVNSYMKSFDTEYINSVIKKMDNANDELNIRVSLPKFKYDYDVKGLKEILKDLGLKETLGAKPHFEKIADYDMSISDVIHKSFIDLSESGTKAAAVTVITFNENAIAMKPPKVVEVDFDKPFIYLIKDSDSDEILFFGVVYTPTEYKTGDKLCEEDQEEVW